MKFHNYRCRGTYATSKTKNARKHFDEFASHHFQETPKDTILQDKAYDNVIQGIEKNFQQKDFLIYRNIQDIFLNAINGKDSQQQLKVISLTKKLVRFYQELAVS